MLITRQPSKESSDILQAHLVSVVSTPKGKIQNCSAILIVIMQETLRREKVLLELFSSLVAIQLLGHHRNRMWSHYHLVSLSI